MTGLVKFYLDPRGRVSRKAFWLGFVLVGVALEFIAGSADATWQSVRTGKSHLLLSLHLNLQFPNWAPLAGLSFEAPFRSAVALIWFWPQVAIFIKRLHDIDRSAKWFVALAAASASVQLLAWIGHRAGLMVSDADAVLPLWFVVSGLALLLGLVAPLILACLPGTRGPNRFGSDPRAVLPAAKAPLEANA